MAFAGDTQEYSALHFHCSGLPGDRALSEWNSTQKMAL